MTTSYLKNIKQFLKNDNTLRKISNRNQKQKHWEYFEFLIYTQHLTQLACQSIKLDKDLFVKKCQK